MRAVAAVGAALIAVGALAWADDTCKNPPVEGALWTWPQGMAVQVNIDPSYSPAQITAIEAAFANWQNANTGAGVTFSFTTNPSPIAGPNFGAPGTYQVSPGAAEGGVAHTGGANSGGRRSRAYTVIEPAVTGTDSLRQTIAHEIGHTFGLDDCMDCTPLESVMSRGAGPDYPINLDAPTSCDERMVKQNGGYGDGGGGGTPPGSGGSGGTCTNCTVRVCHRREDGAQDCNIVVGFCCPKGFIAAEDWETTPTCGYLNFWGPDQYDECAFTCDDTCRKKQYCGDAPCEPWPHYCWKCPDASSGGSSDPPPDAGSTCSEMGWYNADQKSACDSVCGGPDTCGKKQWCGTGICQPWPNYCWKCN